MTWPVLIVLGFTHLAVRYLGEPCVTRYMSTLHITSAVLYDYAQRVGDLHETRSQATGSSLLVASEFV